MDESARGLRFDCRDQGSCANDIHDAREIVGEHTERHSPGGKILLGCKKRPQLRGRFYLIPVVVAAFDDHRPLAAVPVPAAMPTAVVVTELGACTGSRSRNSPRSRKWSPQASRSHAVGVSADIPHADLCLFALFGVARIFDEGAAGVIDFLSEDLF
jgi:hypothetical protein